MSTWRERLVPGSFNGVPFLIQYSNEGFGRRLAVHEFPGRDNPFIEDLGQKATKVTMDIYFLGDENKATGQKNHLDQRDAFLAVALKAGAGTLVHPYYGSLQAWCPSAIPRESSDSLRITRMQVDFILAAHGAPPTVVVASTATGVRTASAAIQTATDGKFTNVYNYGLLTAVQRSAAARTLETVVRAVGKIALTVSSADADVNQVFQQALGNVASLVASAGSIVSTLKTLYNGGPFDVGFNLASIDYWQSIFSNMLQAANLTYATQDSTPSSEAIVRFANMYGIAQCAYAYSATPFSSSDDARATGSTLLDLIENAQITEDDEASLESLEDLRTAVAADLQTRSLQLPSLVEITIGDEIPDLVLSKKLYGDVSMAQDITARNGVVNPAFLPASVPLEVLSSGG